jgi:hypothetical protein
MESERMGESRGRQRHSGGEGETQRGGETVRERGGEEEEEEEDRHTDRRAGVE